HRLVHGRARRRGEVPRRGMADHLLARLPAQLRRDAMAITRRQFLRRSAITAVGLNFGSPLLERVAWGAPRRGAKTASNDRVIVTINLFGGNDGLNTVVPLAQYDRYRELRPTIGIDRAAALALQNAPDI